MSVLGYNVSESEAVIIDSEHDRQPPRSFFCRNGKYIAMVAIVAAFAYRKRVAVIDGAAVHFHQFDAFREVGRRDFQSEGRLVDEGSAVASNGVGEFPVRERDSRFQGFVGRRHHIDRVFCQDSRL